MRYYNFIASNMSRAPKIDVWKRWKNPVRVIIADVQYHCNATKPGSIVDTSGMEEEEVQVKSDLSMQRKLLCISHYLGDTPARRFAEEVRHSCSRGY